MFLGVVITAILVSLIVNGANMESAKAFPVNLGPAVTGGIDSSITWVITNLGWFFDAVSHNLKIALGKLRDFLIWIPWPVIVAVVFLIGWRVASIRVGLASAAGLITIGIVNLWEPAMVTIAIMIVSVSIAVGIGIPIGVVAARSNAFDTLMRPILDAMQTMPSFVYLVPGIMLFGLGNVAAILATVLYAHSSLHPSHQFGNKTSGSFGSGGWPCLWGYAHSNPIQRSDSNGRAHDYGRH